MPTKTPEQPAVPLFSVVVPIHDVRPFLAECLDSILGQGRDDVEVIAVDDASTDGSSELLDTYAGDSRVIVLHLAENVGLGHARNHGLDRARGRYVLFVDSDDSLEPGILDALADRIAGTDDPDLVVFDFVRSHEDGTRVPDPRSAELAAGPPHVFTLADRPAYLELFPSVWNKAYRRDFIEQHGFRFPTGIYEDLPWTYPALVSADRIANLDRVGYVYRQRTGTILRSADRRHLDFFAQFGRVFEFLEAHPEHDRWRIPLYDRLTRHAPWILEIRDRVSPRLRREFFAAASAAFRAHRPDGFVAPSRSAGTKIALIERGDYRAFRAAQLVNLALRRVGRGTAAPPSRTGLDTLLDLLVADGSFASTAPPLSPSEADAVHEDVVAAVAAADPARLRERTDLPEQLRQALLVGVRDEPAPPPTKRVDRLRGLVRYRYWVGPSQPVERSTLDGRPVAPRHAKLRDVSYLGRTLVRERVVWLPGEARLTLDGHDVSTTAVAAADASRLGARLRRVRSVLDPRSLRTILGDGIVRVMARTPAARRRYRDAWLLVDRDSEAQDNAEALYRYLVSQRPDVNAFFVLRPDSPDWNRLHDKGFRLIKFGSRAHYVALLHCAHLVSSQVDTYVNQPFWKHVLGSPKWRFTFLQHGVTQNDLSRWINDKPIDLVLTATQDEQDGFVADGTPYVLTSLDCALTGFTRHDRLLRLAEENRNPRSLLVMPTWRQDLLGERGLGNRRPLRDDFWTSEFALAWRAVLESDRLHALCDDANWTLTFVPHPNLQDYLATSPLPSHVRAVRFDRIDVQRTLADAAVLVTDYSSLAFEAGYLRRPVVYHQFDREQFFAGTHVVRRGSWSYADQGFGPVVTTPESVIDAVEAVVRGAVDPQYAERADRAFAFRDGRCCERAVAAIETLRRPLAPVDAVRPV